MSYTIRSTSLPFATKSKTKHTLADSLRKGQGDNAYKAQQKDETINLEDHVGPILDKQIPSRL